MSDMDKKIYDILTSDTEASATLNHTLFGDNELSGVQRAEYLDRLKDRQEST